MQANQFYSSLERLEFGINISVGRVRESEILRDFEEIVQKGMSTVKVGISALPQQEPVIFVAVVAYCKMQS